MLKEVKEHKYELIKILAIIIVGLFLIFKDNVINVNPTTNGKEILSEKVSIKVHIDTIPFYYPVPKIIEVKIDTPEITRRNDSLLRTYNNPYEDSLIKGVIKTINHESGVMLFQNLSYKPKFPKYIKKDSIVTIEREVTNPKAYLYLGVGTFVGLNHFDVVPQIGFKFKNDMYISGGYGLRYNTININIYKPIKFKRKSKISLL